MFKARKRNSQLPLWEWILKGMIITLVVRMVSRFFGGIFDRGRFLAH